MPSTPFAYSQVVSRNFASFHVPESGISPGQSDFCDGFDSRQPILAPHWARWGRSRVRNSFGPRSTLLKLAVATPCRRPRFPSCFRCAPGHGYAEFAVLSFGIDSAIGEPGYSRGHWAGFLFAGRATRFMAAPRRCSSALSPSVCWGLSCDPWGSSLSGEGTRHSGGVG
jgi:hypothetical protein